jgi:hypothetical protein
MYLQRLALSTVVLSVIVDLPKRSIHNVQQCYNFHAPSSCSFVVTSELKAK